VGDRDDAKAQRKKSNAVATVYAQDYPPAVILWPPKDDKDGGLSAVSTANGLLPWDDTLPFYCHPEASEGSGCYVTDK
jgi:hypothetical protein